MSNIAVVTCYTSNIAELVAPLSQNKQEYCDRWGYKFFLEIISEQEDIWKKRVGMELGIYRFALILKLMREKPNIEIFVWMDNDAFVMNQTTKIEDIISNADLIIGEDWNGINTGVFFIRNNNKCHKFLDNIIKYNPNPFDGRPYWWVKSEQCAVSDMLEKSGLVIDLHHHSLFNGYLIGPRPDNDWRTLGLGPRNPNWQPRSFQLGDFILHLVGTHNNEKLQLIEEYLGKVIK
jgi:hypothetical protein